MSLEDGLTAFKRGRNGDAIAHLEAYCAECQASGSTGSRNYMQAGIALVKAYHADKQIDKAIATCEAFAASDNNNALQIWADKTLLKLQNAPQETEPNAKPEALLTPAAESRDALKQLESGILAQKRGDDESAIESLESYLSICENVRSRNYMQAQMSRVKAYRSMGQLDKAYAICEELATVDNAALQSWASKAIAALRQAGVEPSAQAAATDSPSTQPSLSPNQSKRSPAPVPRKPPARPGVAQMLDNTSTVEVSATSGGSSFSGHSVSSTSSASSAMSSDSSRNGQSTASQGSGRRSTQRSSHSHQSTATTSAAAGTGVAALLGGGVFVLFTKPVFRRALFTVIGIMIALSRACLGGVFTSSDDYADSTYSDYTADALHDAACNGNPQEAQALIQSGTSANVLDSEGNTPLFLAVSGCSSNYETYPVTDGHRAVMTLLIDNGASVATTNNYGQTPLHWAAAWGPTDVTTSLVSHGASIGAIDDYQDTPLHWAAWASNSSSAEALINLGVPLNPVNGDGQTPLDVARDYGSDTMITFLQNQGAASAKGN